MALRLRGRHGDPSGLPVAGYTAIALLLLGTLAVQPASGAESFDTLFTEGKAKVIQAVGYPQPNFSHFRATDIWMSASNSNQEVYNGWAGRYLNYEYPNFPTGYPNPDAPDPLAIQRAYVEAGSDILLTNTFGASRIMLNRHGQGDRTVEINGAAVRVARQALGGRGYVLGDIGPFGGLMEPYGEIAPRDVERAFREQARALVEAGADGIIIETHIGKPLAFRHGQEATIFARIFLRCPFCSRRQFRPRARARWWGNCASPR